MARFSSWTWRRSCGFARASATPMHFRTGGSALKGKLSAVVLMGLLSGSASTSWAETPAADAASSASAPASEAPPAATAPAAEAAAPAAPTEPQLIGIDKINSGDTAWMLTSTALVLMMTIPGLALFYGGMVRKKNVLATVMQSFAITCLVTVLWVIAGY